MKLLCLSTALLLPTFAAPPITFDNLPLGTAGQPFLLRTYVPDPGIDDAVFTQHDQGHKVAKYNPGKGIDVPGEIDPRPGIPAAIAVNFGPALSYTFDTTECRLLYAWQGGFLDMTPYWGDTEKGNRLSFDYVPRLVGTLFHQTSGTHPVSLGGKSLNDLGPRIFKGYRLQKGVPTFEYQVGDNLFSMTIVPSDASPLSLSATLTSSDKTSPLTYRGTDAISKDGVLKFTLTGTALKKFQGYQRDHKITKATVAVGEKLFGNYGCAACHSTDGSASHGPTLAGVAGHMVQLADIDEPVLADDAYLLESIKSPNAKLVKGYPPNYMPPFGLPDVEYESLILYIKSLGQPE